MIETISARNSTYLRRASGGTGENTSVCKAFSYGNLCNCPRIRFPPWLYDTTLAKKAAPWVLSVSWHPTNKVRSFKKPWNRKAVNQTSSCLFCHKITKQVIQMLHFAPHLMPWRRSWRCPCQRSQYCSGRRPALPWARQIGYSRWDLDGTNYQQGKYTIMINNNAEWQLYNFYWTVWQSSHKLWSNQGHEQRFKRNEFPFNWEPHARIEPPACSTKLSDSCKLV